MKSKWIIGLAVLTNSFLIGQINLTQSLTACYTLNGNVNDQINSLTGTLSAVTATVDRFNNPSSALAFNGTTSSFIELPNDPLLKPTNAFSFSGWIKTSLIADQYILMTRNIATSNFEAYDLHFGNDGGVLKIRAKKGDGSANAIIITGTNTLSINTWYHFVLTVDNSTMNLYTNGTLVGTAPITFPFNYLSNKNIILGGSNESIFNLPFTGSMDNLRFYNRILSVNEINMLYTADPTCNSISSVSSHINSNFEITISPNPSSGKFTISTVEEISEIDVYDLTGKLLLNTKNKTEINLSNLSCGVYYVQFKINGKVVTKKIVKE